MRIKQLTTLSFVLLLGLSSGASAQTLLTWFSVRTFTPSATFTGSQRLNQIAVNVNPTGQNQVQQTNLQVNNLINNISSINRRVVQNGNTANIGPLVGTNGQITNLNNPVSSVSDFLSAYTRTTSQIACTLGRTVSVGPYGAVTSSVTNSCQ